MLAHGAAVEESLAASGIPCLEQDPAAVRAAEHAMPVCGHSCSLTFAHKCIGGLKCFLVGSCVL